MRAAGRFQRCCAPRAVFHQFPISRRIPERSFSSSSATDVKVVTYNVLSSSLASPSYFIKCEPRVLDAQFRYQAMLKRLESEIESEAIICLQEVSMKWAGKLHPFFQRRGYHFVMNNYGGKKNGYMGVGMAFPCHRFAAQGVHFSKLSDRISTKKRTKEDETSWLAYFGLQTSPVASDVDEWVLAKRKHNVMIYMQLECLSTLTSFGVASYHMPCVFWAPKVMVIHTALLLHETKQLAGELPYVLAGDFNFVPGSACYRLVTTGRLPSTDPDSPFDSAPPSMLTSLFGGVAGGGAAGGDRPFHREEPRSLAPSEGEGLQSAYLQALGAEPAYTNYAVTKSNSFRDTLDYIFLSRGGWAVQEVQTLPTEAQALEGGPMPTEAEPSDHLLLSAVLRFLAPPAKGPVA
jgi:2',5'-phosphodiesterase